MFLKREFNKPSGWTKQVNTRNAAGQLLDPSKPEGECLNPPPLKGVKILRAGPLQRFSPDLIAKAMQEGWLSMGDGKIVLKGTNKTVTYKLTKVPGYYCCHCGEAQPDGVVAKMHVENAHKGKPSPDASNPAGYMRLNAYEGKKETA